MRNVEISLNSSPLDRLDLRIVEELDRDSSASIRNIAKVLDIPEETTRYRVNRLLSSGLLPTCYAVIDPGLLGVEVHKVLIKLQNVDEARVRHIVSTIEKCHIVNWIVRLDGMFDIGFTVWVRRITELSAFVDTLKAAFHKYIHRVAFAVNLEAAFLPRLLLDSRTKRTRIAARYSVPETVVRVDSHDLAILRSISTNPRVARTDLAKELRITSETVGARITRLEKSRVITGYRVSINCDAWGLSNYYVVLYLRAVSKKRLREFLDHCESHPNVTYVIRALGEWDVELNIEVRNSRQYRETMMFLTRDYSDLVRDFYGMLVPEVYRFSILPSSLALQV